MIILQDWVTDMNLVRLLMAAEMLKPVSPTVSAEDQTVVEYFPHFIIVQNKAEFTESLPDAVQEIESLYSRVLSKSRLQWRKNGDKPLVLIIPDLDGDRSEQARTRMKPINSFEEAVKILRRKVFSLKASPLTQTKLSEKSWVNLANRTWDNIKNSPFYTEYSRLLP